ncbi:myb-related transcription factor, partner of profilin [Plakobranchus ocellatus]|uniref:Myb-related transcription factor, partner of profilin n=1 Tax=Plakobranchus ocellatus TaxID=259542 RepID=A0AAV4ANT0_9GAST|nr:myb-related transcription factor, partner of profilin [Plakobranchus ocellatus]
MADSSFPLKRYRRPNFGQTEIFSLLQDVLLHKDVLFGSKQNRVSMYKKFQVWNSIADKLTIIGGQERSGAQVRKKWNDLAHYGKITLEKQKLSGIFKPKSQPPYMSLVFTILDEMGKMQKSKGFSETGDGSHSDLEDDEGDDEDMTDLGNQDGNNSLQPLMPTDPSAQEAHGVTTTFASTGSSSSHTPTMVLKFETPPDMSDFLDDELDTEHASFSQDLSTPLAPSHHSTPWQEQSMPHQQSMQALTTLASHTSQQAAASSSSMSTSPTQQPTQSSTLTASLDTPQPPQNSQTNATSSPHQKPPSLMKTPQTVQLADSSKSSLKRPRPKDLLKMQLLKNRGKKGAQSKGSSDDTDSLWQEWLRSEISLSRLKQESIRSKLELYKLQREHLEMQLKAMDSKKKKLEENLEEDSTK